MANSNATSRCTLCQEEDTVNDAITWCIDCETFLCLSCNKTHGRIKATREHNIISVENLNELPTFITELTNQCKEHGKRFDAYCSDHSVACCIECIISDHKRCEDVRKLADVLKDLKSSSSVFHVDRNLCDLSENFEKIDKYLTTRLAAVDSQKTNIENQIIKEKQRIMDHLDKIVKLSLEDLESKHYELRSKTERLQTEIQRKKSELEHLQTDFTKMKEFATELQMFEGIKEIEKLATEQIKYIEDCTMKDLLDEHNLEVELAPLLNTILTDLVSFGNISVSVKNSSLQLKQTEGQQVNIVNPVQPTVDQIKPTVTKMMDFPKDRVSSLFGCQILPNGRMVTVEHSKRSLMLFSKEGNYVRDVVTFAKDPYDVTYVKDDIVAVTSNYDVEVYFVDIESNKIIKSINVRTTVCGIDNDGSMLRLTTGLNQSIVNLSHEGKILSRQSIASKALFIATFEDKIYFSEYWDNTISCCEKNYNLLWTFQLEKRSLPRGISVDKYGFVYVACNGSNNITVVSPDGKHSSVIFNQNDGLSDPIGLSIDRKSSTLLVTNYNNGKVYMLQLYK